MKTAATATAPTFRQGELNILVGAPGIPPEVADLVAKHAPAFFAHLDARRATAAARKAVDQAAETDRAAAAEAAIEGTPPPAQHLPQAEKALATAQAAEQVRADALAILDRRIVDAIDRHRPAWLAALDKVDTDADTAVEAALDAIEAALVQRNSVAKLRGIVTNPHRAATWKAAPHVIAHDQTDTLTRLRTLTRPRHADPAA